MDQVPLTVASRVFKRLDDSNLCNARLVCKSWNAMITSSKLWHERILSNEVKTLKLCKSQRLWKKRPWIRLIRHVTATKDVQAIRELSYTIQENWTPLSAKSFTPIHFCAEYGLVRLLQQLLEFTRDKDLQLDFGWPPVPLYFALNYAAKEGHLAVLETFATVFGDDVFTKFKKQYPNGRLSPLYYAERNQDEEMINFLRSRLKEVEDYVLSLDHFP